MCCKAGIITKHNQNKPQFQRKHPPLLMKSQDEIYCYWTDSLNGLQSDCHDTRFAESKPKWEKILASGEVHPRKFIVSDDSPTAWKYDKEKYASNMEEEILLVENLEKSLEWEEDANDIMDGVTQICG